jgi:cbb3-type cytochrome oxidase subunit 3
MKKKFLLLFLILLILGLIWWAYPTVKNRYFQNENSGRLLILPEKQQLEQNTEKNEQQPQAGTSEPTESKTPADSFTKITASDCDNECDNFKDDENNFKYCQEVCGLATPKTEANCENFKNLEKDYCLKDLAVSKKDFSVCDQIQDSGIKKTCKNRITEELLNNQE